MNDSVVEKCKKIMDLAQKEDADLQAISKEIAAQNEILSEVLKRVNAIDIGLSQKIDDPTHASAILGQKKLNDVIQGVLSVHQELETDAKKSVVQKPEPTEKVE